MKKYYAERHGLLTKQLQIDFDELLQYFRQVYKFFCDKEYFEVATDLVVKPVPNPAYKTYDFGEICNAFIDDLIRLMENSIKNEQGNFKLT